MRTISSNACIGLLFVLPAACTVVTADGADAGSPATSSSTSIGSSGSAGSGGSAGSSTGSAGTGGGAGATTGSAGGGGAAGAGGSADQDGGMGTGGAGGAPGDGGNGTNPDAAVPSDLCNGGTETMANEDRDHATAYPLGAPMQACLQNASDVDFYQFTIPTSPAQGGFVKVQITDVGADANVDMHVFAAHDNGEFIANHNATGGGSAFLYFAAKAGATFRVKVSKYTDVAKPTPYLFTAAFNPVNDANEPNDDNAHATPIKVGTPLTGYFFAGLEDSTAPPAAAWEDRFKVTLPAGPVTITLSDIAADMNGLVTLYDPLGSQIGTNHDATVGSTVVLKSTIAAGSAGDCFISVQPYTERPLGAAGSTVPVFYTKPYSLLVQSM